MRKYVLMIVAALTIGLVSCRPDKPSVSADDFHVGKGVFVLNEGTYNFANSSLTFYDYQMDTSANDVFYKINQAPIGDVGQSLSLVDGKLYFVVNNSNYIYKVDAKTLKYEAKLSDFYSPREMLAVAPDKAYVSDLVGTGLWIVNPQDMSHVGSIEMGKGTESMALVGNELCVCNWSNYYHPDVENNTVQVVDVVNDMKVAEIVVGKEPNSIVVDKNHHVWVLCSGGYVKDAKPELCCIDMALKRVVKRFVFEEGYPTCYPTRLAIDNKGETLYFIANGVFAMSVSDEALPSVPFVEAQSGMAFYNIDVEPKSGDVYVTDARNYSQNGFVYRYSSDGLLISSFESGIIPSDIVFN